MADFLIVARIYTLNTLHPNHWPSEVNKFSDLASQWWDSKGPLHTLHDINPIRVDWIQERTPLKGLKVLDVGCGGGLLTEAMSQLGAEVTGIDLSEKLIKIAQLHCLNSHAIDYLCIPVEEYARLHPAEFDVVTCLEMLEHVPRPEEIISACAHLVKPQGSVYFSTINRNKNAYFQVVLAAEYILQWLPRGTHDYEHFIKPSELTHYARQEELNIKAIMGITYNPLSQSFVLTENTGVNYMTHYVHS